MASEKAELSPLHKHYHFSKAEGKKYPVVSRVLEKLTPEEIDKRVQATINMQLPEEAQKWVREYDKVGRRNPLTWKRTYRHSCVVNFSDTTKENVDFLINTKFLMFMFIILLDDVADVWQSKKLLDEILKIPYEEKFIQMNKLKEKEQQYLKFTMKVWKNLLKRLKSCPNYEKFEEVLEYNVRQMLQGRRYGYLVNRNPQFINRIEVQSYLPASVCSMQILEDFTIDFMFAPNLSIEEYGKVRDLIYCTQQMTRRGNWVSGWVRELSELDFTSGIVAYALDKEVITVEDLINMTQENYMEVAEKIRKSDVEKTLLMEWEDNYNRSMKIAEGIGSTDAKKYTAGIEELLGMVLTSAHAM